MKKKETGLSEYSDAVAVELPEIDDYAEKNEYYLSVARRFKLARLLMIMLLVLYALLMLTFFGEDITVSNFKYLLRDINISSSSGEAFSKVSYSAEPIQRFDIYRGELLYVTGGEVRLYSATGNTGLSSELSYEEPTTVSTDKYVLIYDLGGDTFSLYNSFSELYRESTEYNIISADISEDGSFAVATKNREYKGAVYLYNDDFEMTARYLKRDYVTDIALSADGGRLVIGTVASTSSGFITKLYFYEPGMDTELAVATVANDYPAAVERTANGFVMIGADGVYFFDNEGVRLGECMYGGAADMYDATDSYVILTLPQNTLGNRNRVLILDSAGMTVYNKVIDEKLSDVAVSEHGEAFLLTANRAVMIDIGSDTEKSVSVVGSAKRILPIGKETALLCMSSGAETVDFNALTSINN